MWNKLFCNNFCSGLLSVFCFNSVEIKTIEHRNLEEYFEAVALDFKNAFEKIK